MKVSDLNFSEIKEALKNYLNNNTDFVDYNFEGSGLSVLLDILAYNTYYNAVFLNMAINENFLGTAIKRGSLASIAKNFGYTPKSRTSSRMKIFIEIPTTEPDGSTLVIDKTYTFSSSSSSSNFVFTPKQTYTLTAQDGKYSGELELVEGVWIEQEYPAGQEKYIIPEFNIDTSFVEVYEETATSEIIKFDLFKNLKEINDTTNIYYLFETPFRTYEVLFGDGVLGRKPNISSKIVIRYKTSSGEAANNLSNIVYTGPTLIGTSEQYFAEDINYINIIPSFGGSETENLDSIRKNTLLSFYAQERAVTANDYKFFLEKEYPFAKSISVWGGQDNDPPIYGKVFISIFPKNGLTISNIEKQDIINNIIKKRNVVTVIPEIVDPEYTFLVLNSTVKYDTRKTLNDPGQIKALILSKIEEFNNNELGKFDTYFNYSKFITEINNIDPSIIGNNTIIQLKKYIPFTFNLMSTYIINFKNSIKERSFVLLNPIKMETDNTINTTLDIYLEDENGIVYAYTISSIGEKIRKKAIGTIDYFSGKVELNMNVTKSVGREDNTMIFVATPNDFDVQMKFNDILTIEPSDITLKVIAI